MGKVFIQAEIQLAHAFLLKQKKKKKSTLRWDENTSTFNVFLEADKMTNLL